VAVRVPGDRPGRLDVVVSAHRDAYAARRFFQRTLAMLKVTPRQVLTDAAAIYPAQRVAAAFGDLGTAINPIPALAKSSVRARELVFWLRSGGSAVLVDHAAEDPLSPYLCVDVGVVGRHGPREVHPGCFGSGRLGAGVVDVTTRAVRRGC
jgi:hypothetical protein